MSCTSKRIVVGELDRKLAAKKARMDAIFDAIEDKSPTGMLRRVALGLMTGEVTDNPMALSKATEYFIYNTIGRMPPKDSFILDDVEISMIERRLLEATDDARRAVKKGQKLIKKYGSVEAVMSNKEALSGLEKFWAARGPVTMAFAHARHLPGGEEFFNNLMNTESGHEGRRKKAATNIEEVARIIRAASGAAAKDDWKRIANIDSELARLGDEIVMLNEAAEKGDLKSSKAIDAKTNEIAKLKNERRKFYDNEIGKGTKYGAANRAIVEMLEHPKNMEIIADKYNKSHGLDQRDLINAAKLAKETYADFADVGKETVRYAKRLIEGEMYRVGATESQTAEAIDAIRDMGVFEDGFFPHQTVMSVRPVEGVSVLRAMIDMLQSSDVRTPDKALDIVKKLSGHMQKRTGEVDPDLMDYDVAKVTKDYAESMLHSNYIVKMHNTYTQYLKNLWHIGNSTGDPAALAFAIQADKFMDFTRRRLVGTQSHGAMHELSVMIFTTTVLQKLGMWRPAGRIRNRVEGDVMIASRIGLHNMARIDKKLEESTGSLGSDGESSILNMSGLVTEVMREHRIQLGARGHLGEEPNIVVTPKIKSIIDNPELAELYIREETARRETAAIVMKRINSILTSATDKSMNWQIDPFGMFAGWSKTENALREKAFKYGSVLAGERAERTYGAMFNNPTESIPKFVSEKFDLDASVLDGNPQNAEARANEYRKLVKAEMLKGGLSLLYRTQGMYSTLSRHPIEDVNAFGLHVGKMAHLFRAYPESWNTTFLMALKDVYYASKVGMNGRMSALVAPPRNAKTKKISWEYEMPPALALASLVAMIGVGAWSHDDKERFGIPLRVSGLFQGDVPKSYAYLRDITSDDEETRKRANYGKGAVGMFTSPIYGELEWLLNYGNVSFAAMNDNLPLGTSTAARVLGYHPDAASLRMQSTPESLGDIGKGAAMHHLQGYSMYNDIMYIANQYNDEKKVNGNKLILSIAKRFFGLESTKDGDNPESRSIRP